MSSSNLHQQDLEEILEQGLKEINLQLGRPKVELLFQYIDLLCKWGKAFNLTSIESKEQMLIKHILDSLTIYPYLTGKHCLDIGTGAGLPGIPLSLVYPEMHFSLLDSNAKKIRFVRQALLELKLENVDLKQCRVENLKSIEAQAEYSCILSRAFSSLRKIVEMCYPLKASEGSVIAMKGKISSSELEELRLVPFKLNSVQVEALKVPYLKEERHLVIVR